MAWYSSWYWNRRRWNWNRRRQVDTTPKLNSYNNAYYENSYLSRLDTEGRYQYSSRRRSSYSQTRSRQSNLNEDSGVVTLGSSRTWSTVKRQASKYDDILESKGKSDAYYVSGKGYVAIDNDVAVEIEAKYDRGSRGLNWKIAKEYGLGAAKWYQAKQTYDYYTELADKYSKSGSYWQRRYAKYYQARADRYKPIDNGDGTFEIRGEAPLTIEPGTGELKVLSRNAFKTEDGDVITLKETRVSSYWGWGSRKGSFSQDTLLGVQEQTGIGGISWKILTSRGSGKSKKFYEFDVSDKGIVFQNNLGGKQKSLTSALEKKWDLDLDGSGQIGDAVITKRTTFSYESQFETDTNTLVAGVTENFRKLNTYKNTIEKTFTDGVFTNEFVTRDLLSSRQYGTTLSLKESSLYSPTSSYEFTQSKTSNGFKSGDVGGLKYATGTGYGIGWGRRSWYYRPNYNVTNQGIAHRGYKVDGDLNIDVDAINNFGGNYARTNVDGTYSTWLIGKDNSDTTINIDAKGTGAHSYSSWRYNNVSADGLSYSRVVTGSGDDTITINAEAELNGLNRGYVTGYRDSALARGAERSSIQMGDGDDTLTIRAQASSNINRGRIGEYGIDRTKIEMGAGDDTVTIDTLTGQSARNSLIDMGEGDDILTLGGRFDKLSAGNVFKGGEGFDTIVFNNLSETDFNNLSRQSFSFSPNKVTLGSSTFEGFEQVQIGDNISFKPTDISSTAQFTDFIKPEVFV